MVQLQALNWKIPNYFWLTTVTNPVMVLEISLIGLAVSKK